IRDGVTQIASAAEELSAVTEQTSELNTRLAGPIDDFVVPAHWTRKQLRSMGRVSRLAVWAAEQALQDAGLLGDESIKDGR
ncbi:beta-ketoacyl-ACP synthase, partial [Klebsiella pneumoniae]